MSINELEAKVRELKELQTLIEEAQEEAESIKDQLKAHMGEREELRAGGYKITWKPVTSSRLDATALRKALPEVAERFTHSTTVRRFCVA
jgi:predicted phage-related endonuclease